MLGHCGSKPRRPRSPTARTVVPVQSSAERIHLQSSHGSGPTKPWRGAAALGVLVFLAVFSLRTGGLLFGPMVLPVLGLSLLLLPVAKHMSGRIMWTFTVMFGIVPLLWWVPVAWPPTLRSTLLLAAVAGISAFCAVRSWTTNRNWRSLWPETRFIDVLPLAAGAVGSLVHLQHLSVRRVEDAMSLMLMAWDNASHFNIFHMQRTQGTVLPAAGLADDGSRWAFSDYPQGFHSALVLVSELVRKTSPQDWEADSVTYVNFSALMNIAVVVLVVAAVCSLPALRKNTLYGAPIAAFVAAGWLFGPGALASMHGFPNFFFTAGLAASGIIILHSMRRPLDPLPLIAVGACAAGVVQNWALLGIFLIPSVLAVLFVTPRGRWRSRRVEVASASVVAGVVLAAAMAALKQLLSVPPDDILFAVGGVPDSDLGLLLALLLILAGMYTFLRAGIWSREPIAVRARWSIGSVGLGAALAVAMATAQLINSGTVSYYTQKFAIALALVSLVVLSLAAGALLEVLGRPKVTITRAHGFILCGAFSLAATQAYGFPFPMKSAGLAPSSASAIESTKQETALKSGSDARDRLLGAVRRAGDTGVPAMYLTTHPAELDVILAQQWFDSLRSSYSEHSWKLSLNMFPLSGGPENLRKVILDIRYQDSGAQLIVDPENQVALDEILGSIP